MCKGIYQKIIVFALLSTIYVIYVLNQLARHSGQRQRLYFVQGRLYYMDNEEPQLNLPLGDVYRPNRSSPTEVVNLLDKQEPNSPPVEVHVHYKQQPNFPSEEVNVHVTQQSDLPTGEKSTLAHIDKLKIDQQLLDLAKNVDFNTSVTVSKVYKYISNTFSPSQVTSLVARMVDVANLSAKAQQQFLYCAGLVVLRNLNGSQPKTPIPAPPSRQHCRKMSFKTSGPVIALSSCPGSGNSWVRQLLESATGIYTGAVYCDPAYVKAGMIGELIDTNNVLTVKTHYVPSYVSKILRNDKAVYVVRSPFGTILAENNRNIARMSKKYKQKDFHTEEVDFNYENNPAWERQVRKQARTWRIHVMQWLNYRHVPVLIIGYENLKKDTYTELKKMLDFIGYPYTEEDLLCAVKSSAEAFHRNHTKKNLHPYSPELQKVVLNEIRQVDAGLLKHGISLNHPYEEN